MADSTIPNLVAVSVPALTDLLGVRQSGDSRDKKLTVTQLLSLAPGGGDVTKVGTPADNQLPVWTGDGTIEGSTNFNVVGVAIQSALGNGPEMRNVATGAASPGLLPRQGDTNTGIYSAGDDRLGLASGGISGMILVEASGGVVHAFDTTLGVTAFATGGQGSATELFKSYNVVTTVASPGDSVKLPLSNQVGSLIYVKNDGANACDVFPSAGDDLGQGINVAVSLAAGKSIAFMMTVANSTWTQIVFQEIAGTGDVSKVGTPVDNQIGVWTGDGTIEGDANFRWDGSHLLLPLNDDAAAPTLAFGDGDTGIYESVDDTLKITLGGTARWTFTGDRFVGVAGNGPSLQNEASTATNPTLIPALGDPGTGIGGVTSALDIILGGASAMHFRKAGAFFFIESPNSVFESRVGTVSGPTYSFSLDSNSGMYSGGSGSDQLKFSAGGVEAISLNELNSGVIQSHQANVAITAFATGGQGSAVQLDESYNVLSVVATTGDSVKLPPVFAVNSVVYIKNDGANAADVFPATGDDLGAGTNTAISLASGESASFIATVANATWTQWIVSAGGGGGDVTKVGTPVNNQIGVWTGDGTLEGDANLIWDGSKLDITTGRIELPGGSAAAPPIGFQIDTGTGIYRVGNNNFGIASGGLASVSWLRQTGQIIQTNSLHTGLTASTTQTQNQAPLFSSYNVVSTVANANDVVTAMLAVAGKRLTIYNDGANILQVFPSTSDDIGAGVNSSITIAVGASKSWISNDGVTWLLIGSAP